ncbi:phage scaffolding protein [Streptomyces sp. NBC_00124]|uniref:phage scaffolding protein n=1 Tax=Streptomyces sp. NBC_00124 TaxID=2975662 RepID=UPI00225A7ADD|nr:phage scaffolding protein [Streptomyces sp. NBC_00124]MCX5365939.1 phage scaffolding protein [Streptomyces sp. NBC_00124]
MSDTEFDNTPEPDDTDTETQDVDSGVEDGDGETVAEAAAKPKPPADKKSDESAAEPFTPPTEAEWRRIQTALKKANDDAKRNRFRAKELEEKTRADETEHEKALREAREEGEKRYRAPLVKAAARAALSEAGLGGSTDRVLRLLDLEALSVDDDGDVIGLDGEVARIKDEYPEFFQTDKPKSRVRPTAADRKPAEERPKSSAERHAAKVLGRAG